MYDDAALPGFIAGRGGFAAPEAAPAAAPEVPSGVTESRHGAATLTSWGLGAAQGHPHTMVLSRVARDTVGRVTPEHVAEGMRVDPRGLTSLLPPFAAVTGDDDGITMVADSMGFRQLFHTDERADADGVLATSALLVGWTQRAALDETALAVQSLVGWQLGQRTLHDGVHKLTPGASARLDAGGVSVAPASPADASPITLAEAVSDAAALLRRSLAGVLDDEPDAVLQLTGGLDSRLLLAAIPPARRRGLRAMTLGSAESGDVRIASKLAARFGIRHEVYEAADLGDVAPAEAWEACRAAAIRLDGMADPVTLAVLGWDERSFEQGVRISGLGGEVARGFYYMGSDQERPVTAREASRLAAWRLFANESIEPGVLVDDFSAWARDAADAEVLAALQSGGSEWLHATDSLYLRHRMQRWAGATDTAVAYQRVVINPMLDEQFITLAQRLSPQDKGAYRYLSSLLLELDPQLATIPLEGRLAPSAYAHPTRWQGVANKGLLARKLASKALQRVRGANRAPAGVVVLAGKVVEHWRRHPEILEPLAATGYVDQEWLDGVVRGAVQPRPSTVGFLANVIVASVPLV